MFWTGINGTDLLGRAFKLSFCLATVGLMLFSSGCTNSALVRKSRLVEPEAPAAIVAEAIAETADDRAEVVAAEIEQPAEVETAAEAETAAEVETVSDGTGSEVAAILQQTRGAVFASLSTPVGAGPPAASIKLDEPAEAEVDSGAQDSVSSQTAGDAATEVEAEGIETPVSAGDEAQEPAVTEEVAEANVAEAIPEPAEETPAREEAETAEAEVARVESPPESVATPTPEPPAAEVLTSNNLGAVPARGGRSNTASVLFLVLGGIGAALILIRKRVAA